MGYVTCLRRRSCGSVPVHPHPTSMSQSREKMYIILSLSSAWLCYLSVDLHLIILCLSCPSICLHLNCLSVIYLPVCWFCLCLCYLDGHVIYLSVHLLSHPSVCLRWSVCPSVSVEPSIRLSLMICQSCPSLLLYTDKVWYWLINWFINRFNDSLIDWWTDWLFNWWIN